MSQHEIDWTQIRQQLLAPFRPEQVKWRKQSNQDNQAVPYLEEEDIRRRLDEVVPGWGCQLRPSVNGHAAYICRIELHGVGREDVGECAKSGADHEHKAAATDAFKRASQRWGIGNFLDYLKRLDAGGIQYGKHPGLTRQMVEEAARRAGWMPDPHAGSGEHGHAAAGEPARSAGDRSTPRPQQRAQATLERHGSYAGAAGCAPPPAAVDDLGEAQGVIVCSTPNCGKQLKAAQKTVSLHVFGQVLCVDCQRAESTKRNADRPREVRPARPPAN